MLSKLKSPRLSFSAYMVRKHPKVTPQWILREIGKNYGSRYKYVMSEYGTAASSDARQFYRLYENLKKGEDFYVQEPMQKRIDKIIETLKSYEK